MPIGIQAESLGDLLTNTLKDLGRPKFTDLSVSLQDFPAVHTLLKKNRVVLESGKGIQWNMLMNHSNAAENQGLYAPDNIRTMDGMIQASMEWRHSTTNWGIDRREVAMNRSPAQIVDLLKERRIQAMTAMVVLMENNFWRAPASTDTDSPKGVPYFVTKNASEGFNGGHLTGYSDCAGVSATTYSAWNNYTAPYTSVSPDDFMRKLRKACRLTKFTPPVEMIPTFNTGDAYSFFTTESLVASLEELLMAQNENLGDEIVPKYGSAILRRTPVKWVPRLDEDTTNPFYGLNFGVFKTYVLRGCWMTETRTEHLADSHNVMAMFVDSTYQWVCKDRRRQFVISNGTTYPNL
jgi:hypothetical protein